MEAYLMGDLTAKGMNTARYYSGGNGRTIVKYQLRSVHLYAVYLLIHWRKDNCEIFYEYFDSLTENYTAYNNSSSEKNLRLLIRTWLYLIHRRSSIENDLIDSLHKANK